MKETKAYQLLKKSTLQDNSNQAEERFESQFSGLDIGGSMFTTKTAHKIASEASFSSSEGSPLSRHESKRDPVTTIKSNAFWGSLMTVTLKSKLLYVLETMTCPMILMIFMTHELLHP